ncbi:adenylyltransferase/cytidyltransferase family protein [Labilibaculum manganireducens]|nr:adenylyltransferase/cytidyltransferase family protein [Labilibaculum manganireducens]
MTKFYYPQSLIKEYKYWLLLLRKDQVTLGSMILICKEEKTSFQSISSNAMSELSFITKDVEIGINKAFGNQKINYLMLMMVDPEVHFHVIPRYEKSVTVNNQEFIDAFWPGPVNFAVNNNLVSSEMFSFLQKKVQSELGESSPQKKYKRIYTSGCFDLFHYGHLNILENSKKLCEHLIVGVSTDELIFKSKGKKPVIPYAERAKIISSIRFVDEVIPQGDKNKQKVVDEHHIDAISVGDDWKGKYPSVSCEMVYFPYTPSVSSTILKDTLKLIK